jgi:hypothetical protein
MLLLLDEATSALDAESEHKGDGSLSCGIRVHCRETDTTDDALDVVHVVSLRNVPASCPKWSFTSHRHRQCLMLRQ